MHIAGIDTHATYPVAAIVSNTGVGYGLRRLPESLGGAASVCSSHTGRQPRLTATPESGTLCRKVARHG